MYSEEEQKEEDIDGEEQQAKICFEASTRQSGDAWTPRRVDALTRRRNNS